MYLIDLSHGVSPLGLLVAIGLLRDDHLEILRTSLEGCLNGKIEFKETIEGIISVIKDTKSGVDSRNIDRVTQIGLDEHVAMCGPYAEKMNRITSPSSQIQIARFDFVVYLSLVILLEKPSIEGLIKGTVPCIGMNSSIQTLQMFEKERCILDVSGKIISSILSAIFLQYFRPFIDTVPCLLSNVRETYDPIEYNSVVRIFEVNKVETCEEISETNDFIAVLEMNIDDITAEILSAALRKILKEGALDYTITPVLMKKERSGFHIQVLCRCPDAEKITDVMMRSTSTFGVRKYIAERKKLRRISKAYETKFGRIMIKEGFLGDELIKVTPEFDDILRLSEKNGISPFTLYNCIIGELNKNLI